MSAIFGLIHLDDQPVVQSDLERTSAALAHHGADGGAWTRGPVGLGMRLRQCTPEDQFERQPLVRADGALILVSDARIDNRDELIPQLPVTNYPFPSQITDSELILCAYEKWGEACVNHLVGVFAFAIWEARSQRLFLARSPIEAPMLCYYAAPRVFAFASMPSGLFALPFVPRALDEERLADLLVQTGSEPRFTFYRDIFRLPIGHALTIGRDGMNLRRYWQPDLKREIRLPRDEDYLAAFDDLLERVVRDQLRSQTPVGVMMSGGLDSSTVAATAARLLAPRGERLAAFTEVPRSGFDGSLPAGRYADETPFVQAIAAMYDNLDLNLIRTDGRTVLSDLDGLFFHLESPFRNAANRVWIETILQEARQRGIGVLLDGGQGNLTISWDGGGLLPSLLRGFKWARAYHEARALARRGAGRSTLRVLVSQGILPLLPTPLWRAVAALRGNRQARAVQPWRTWSPIHPDFAAAQRVDERARARGYDFLFHDTRDSRVALVDALASQDGGAYLSAFRSMFGVDVRSPLGDARLAEFCLALPEEQYLRDGEPRALVRRAMAGRLPPQVLANRQRGLQAADWYERSANARREFAAALDALEGNDLARRALDLARMRRLVEQWPQDGWGEGRVLAEYRFLLESGLMVGRFLQWFETEQGKNFDAAG